MTIRNLAYSIGFVSAIFLCLSLLPTLSADSLAIKSSYSVTKRYGKITRIEFHHYPFVKIVPLVSDKAHVKIRMTATAQKIINGKTVDFELRNMGWIDALQVLVVDNNLQFIQRRDGSCAIDVF